MFTLVHEMGHSIHTSLANENNPFHDADYSLFVAEVASVTSESLFFNWLLDQTQDPTGRLALLNLRMNNITGTFLRQIFFHEFEATAHRAAEAGEPLTKDALDTIWGDLWLEYYGKDATLDDVYRSGWARIPHFYRTFYVWVYATSFAAGEAIAERFRSGDETAVEDYLATLKLGGSVYPMEALARAGVDMNDPKVISTVMDTYQGILAEMAKPEKNTSGTMFWAPEATKTSILSLNAELSRFALSRYTVTVTGSSEGLTNRKSVRQLVPADPPAWAPAGTIH